MRCLLVLASAELARRADLAVSTLSADAQVETELLGSSMCCCEKPEDEYPVMCKFVSGLWAKCPEGFEHMIKPHGKKTTGRSTMEDDCDQLNLKIFRKQPGTGLPEGAIKPLERREKVTRAEKRKSDPMQKCRQCVPNPQNAKLSWLLNQPGGGNGRWAASSSACTCDPEDAGAGRVTTCSDARDFYACETEHALPKCNMCYFPNREDLPLNERRAVAGSSQVFSSTQCECANGKVTTCSQAIGYDVCNTATDRITCNMCLGGSRQYSSRLKRPYTLQELKKDRNFHYYNEYKHTWECECEESGVVTNCHDAVDGDACAAPPQPAHRSTWQDEERQRMKEALAAAEEAENRKKDALRNLYNQRLGLEPGDFDYVY